MKIKVSHDLDKLSREIAEAVKKAEKAAEQELKQTAYKIESDAKSRAPVDTGQLRASIFTQQLGKMSYEIGSDLEYAKYVEFGTIHMGAQPYIIPAFELAITTLKSRIEKATKSAFR